LCSANTECSLLGKEVRRRNCKSFSLLLASATATAADSNRYDVIERCQQAVAKVYGSGGVAGLENYQSGTFLDGEPVRVLTVDSAVLEENTVSVVDALGDRCEATLVGRDARTGLALLECPAAFSPPVTVDLGSAETARLGQRVWVVSNAFGIATGDEPVSVQRGRLAAFASMPTSSNNAAASYRPTLGAPSAGTPVLLLDAITSNPGAGGGVVFSHTGSVFGIVGAECRSPSTGAWVNYALPAETANEAVGRLLARSGGSGRDVAPLPQRRVREALRSLGLRLIPPITDRAPAYVEYVTPGGVADAAGCVPDDLIVAIAGATVGTVETAERMLTTEWERAARVELLVLRDNRLVTLLLEGAAP
ncbi:MAG: S1C family serine protease, partial [Planctomycetota bacterium]